METRQQRLIRQALEAARESSRPEQNGSDAAGVDPAPQVPPDTSLRGKSLRHTQPDYVPRTLTAHEWEDYYREHGVPREHRSPQPRPDTPAKKTGDLTAHRRS